MPRCASCAARIVPDAPPPTIATVVERSDFVVRPVLRVGRARLTPRHMLVHAGNRLAGGLGENSRHDRVNKAGAARSDQPGADRDGAHSMARPAHSQRARMIEEQPVDISCSVRRTLLRRHTLPLHSW